MTTIYDPIEISTIAKIALYPLNSSRPLIIEPTPSLVNYTLLLDVSNSNPFDKVQFNCFSDQNNTESKSSCYPASAN